ncbi:hypothetical protein [Microbacterium sp.]|uniref:hypothetical protein n=1 Tax=Microbacterium sp. TaxID=51671 RepID=UPI0039E2BF6E
MTESPRSSHLTSSVTLTRDDIISGLTELVKRLHDADAPARIQLVGGAAIALTINADRVATRDVDAPLTPAADVLAAAEKVALTRGWPIDWLNDKAAQFVPDGYGRAPEWTIIHKDHLVTIEAASPETLLAMKLHAAQRRRLREAEDLLALLPTCGISTVEEAEVLYADFYPGDEFTESTASIVSRLLETHPAAPPTPPPPRIGS